MSQLSLPNLPISTREIAAKRAAGLSHRAAMIIGAAAASLAGTPPDLHYKGYIGFAFSGGLFVWIGHGGGCRVTRGARAGSPRTFHARPDVGDRLAALGRKLVAQANLPPRAYKPLLAKGGALRHIADGGACLDIRRCRIGMEAKEKAAA